MPGTSSTMSSVSRNAFRSLIALWVFFLCAAVAIVVLAFPISKANAMEPLPFPKVAREIAPPSITSFSTVPPKEASADRCQSLLNTVPQDTRSKEAVSFPARRPAGNSQQDVQMVKVKAIQAYRQCKSHTALQQLAAWRWSR